MRLFFAGDAEYELKDGDYYVSSVGTLWVYDKGKVSLVDMDALAQALDHHAWMDRISAGYGTF